MNAITDRRLLLTLIFLQWVAIGAASYLFFGDEPNAGDVKPSMNKCFPYAERVFQDTAITEHCIKITHRDLPNKEE